MENKNQQITLRIALAISLCVLGFVGYIICRYHPTGIVEDERGNIELAVLPGKGEVILTDSINILPMTDDLLTDLVRTNGASYGKVRYGHFVNQKLNTPMFLYLTGQSRTVCFKYKGRLYVTDDWRDKTKH